MCIRDSGTISNVYNRADVRVVNSETSVSIKYAGGITAVNLGNIFRAYNSGSVIGTSDISGVAGISASNMAESSADAQAGVEYGICLLYTSTLSSVLFMTHSTYQIIYKKTTFVNSFFKRKSLILQSVLNEPVTFVTLLQNVTRKL